MSSSPSHGLNYNVDVYEFLEPTRLVQWHLQSMFIMAFYHTVLSTGTDLGYEHTYSGAERPAACDLIRGNKAVDLFPRIKSRAAGRSAVCVFLP